MRDNGLNATSYTPVGEIAPELADAVLRSLADEGIAAYSKAEQPLEIVYVDAAETDRGREVVRRATDHAAFDALVAQFDTEDETGAHPWPDAEDIDDDAPDEAHPAESGTTVLSPAARAADEHEEQRVRREAARDDDHDHYVPPEPARGPRLDWISRLAWLGVIGGPVVLVLAAMLDTGHGSKVLVAALVAFAGGFLTLVTRLRNGPPIDDTPDDGAVI